MKRPFHQSLAILATMFAVSADSHRARAQDDTAERDTSPTPNKQLDASLLKPLEQFSAPLREFDWKEEYPRIATSLEKVWAHNDWNSEADIFARDVALGISKIPPWNPLGRVYYLSEKFADRYDATPELKLRFSMAVVREGSGLFLRHGETLLAHAQEYLELREAGQPLTAGDVARWAREGQPIMDDIHGIADRVAKELHEQMSPAQREIFKRDVKSYQKRRDAIVEQMDSWSRGEWDPKQWGLDNDPIQANERPGEPGDPSELALGDSQNPTPPAVSHLAPIIAPIKCDEFEPTSWGACAAESVERYKLDAGQRTTADSIVAELSSRALDYARRHNDRLGSIPAQDRPTHPDFEPIRRAFREMKDRLQALPTTAQRARATQDSSPADERRSR